MKIKIAIVDSRITEAAQRKLMLNGYRVITLPPFSRLSEAVASHPDMLIKAVGKDYISYADYCEEASYVFTDLSLMTAGSGARFCFSADDVSSVYPKDVGLNALTIGGALFCRVASASKMLIDQATKAGLKIVNVNQGYPACTVLKLNENAAITADEGMARALEQNGIRVTKITQGHVSLPPHEYGFIGGAGAVNGDKLYLFGDPKTHPDYEKIENAARSEGLTVVSLDFGIIRDLGGILFIECDVDQNSKDRN